MRVRRAAVVGLAVTGLVAATAGVSALAARLNAPGTTAAQIQTLFDFCADAQVTVAGLVDPLPGGYRTISTIYQQEDAGQTSSNDPFVLSKSGADPTAKTINTVTSVIYRNGSLVGGGFRGTNPKQLNCKMRTRDSIDQGAWPGGSTNNSPGFEQPPYFGFGAAGTALLNPTPAEPQTCEAVNDRTIASVWDGLSPAQQGASPFTPGSTLVTNPDAENNLGPNWTASISPGSGSYLEPAVNASGTLTLRSSRLISAWNDLDNPIGPRARGAFYCSLVAPEYLRALLTGGATAPVAP